MSPSNIRHKWSCTASFFTGIKHYIIGIGFYKLWYNIRRVFSTTSGGTCQTPAYIIPSKYIRAIKSFLVNILRSFEHVSRPIAYDNNNIVRFTYFSAGGRRVIIGTRDHVDIFPRAGLATLAGPLIATKTHKHVVPTATVGRTLLKVQLSGVCFPRSRPRILYRRLTVVPHAFSLAVHTPCSLPPQQVIISFTFLFFLFAFIRFVFDFTLPV